MTMVADRPGSMVLAAFGLITATILAAQIVLSRLLASTLTYYYAFMLISLAMLGLAAGGLAVQLLPRVFSAERLGRQAAGQSAAMGLAAFLGTLGMLWLYPKIRLGGLRSFSTTDYWLLAGIFWCFFPLFLFGGTVVSLVLNHARARFHLVYAVDLAAAAGGCLLAVLVLTALTPVEAMLGVVAVLPLLAGALFALGDGRRPLAGGLLALALGVLAAAQVVSLFPRVTNPPHLAMLARPTVLTAWNAQSSVRVYPGPFFTWSLSTAYRGPRLPMLDMVIDGVGGTQIVAFDGDPRTLGRYEYLDYDLTAVGQRLVPPEGRQLIIGPGGGVDILQAVRRGRADITAVEINPLIAEVVNDDLAPFSGRPYRLPGVRVFIENGRTFIKRSREAWDLISLTWVDTGGSATALAFSENYLYTVEAYQEFIRHLRPDGFMAFMRALGYEELIEVDTMRGIAVTVEALRREGVAEAGRHLLVAATRSPYFFNRAMCYVLVKRSAFTAGEVRQARDFLEAMAFEPLWLPDGTPDPSTIRQPFSLFAPTIRSIITRPDREAFYREAPFDVWPTTDDNPFYFVQRSGPNRRAGIGVTDLAAYLLILGALLVPFLGLPLIPVLCRTSRLGVPGAAVLLYFCLLGLGFLLVEIEFFHVFSLVLGSPTATLVTVLATLLVGSGLGSLLAGRLSRAGAGAIAGYFLVFLALLGAFLLAKDGILSSLVGLPFPLRVAGTIAVIAPLAFCMGLPMPTAARMVAHRSDVLLWGWALNGAFSVVASVAAVFLALHVGIAATFATGAACYLAAAVLIHAFRGRVPPAAAPA